MASKTPKGSPTSPSGKTAKPVLLSGGNPQIAKGYGDAPVRQAEASFDEIDLYFDRPRGFECFQSGVDGTKRRFRHTNFRTGS